MCVCEREREREREREIGLVWVVISELLFFGNFDAEI